MKKPGKSVLIAVILVICFFILVRFLVFHRTGEEKIDDFVTENKISLEQIALDCINGNESDISGYRGVTVSGMFPGDHVIVQFDCSSFGLAPSTVYSGFYYSPDNVPVPFQNSQNELLKVSDEEWSWSDGTDNRGITRKIDDYWFYYKAWF